MPFDYFPGEIQDPPAGPPMGFEPVWSGSSPGAIDLENASRIPERVYGTALDNAYLAEQRGQSMLDPRYAIAQAKLRVQAEEEAVRFAGQKEFEQLVSGGATPEEALRRTASKLFWNHPDKMAMALSRTPAPGAVPHELNAIPITSGGEQIGNAVYGPGGKLHSTQFSNPHRTPPDVVASQKVLSGEIDGLERDLNRQRKAMEDDPNNSELARAALNTQQRLTDLRQQYVAGSTNWMGRPSTPPRVDLPTAAPATSTATAEAKSPFKEGEIVRNKKDGKRYRIVKGEPVPL